MRRLKYNILIIFSLSLIGTKALGEKQIFTTTYELSVSDSSELSSLVQPDKQLVNSLKRDITNIVLQAPELRNFPIDPERVLKKVVFHTPITQVKIDGVEFYAFTVDVPIVDPIRNILLKVWFSDDIRLITNSDYALRLHKEPGRRGADVGIIIVRGSDEADLELPEVTSAIRSFSVF